MSPRPVSCPNLGASRAISAVRRMSGPSSNISSFRPSQPPDYGRRDPSLAIFGFVIPRRSAYGLSHAGSRESPPQRLAVSDLFVWHRKQPRTERPSGPVYFKLSTFLLTYHLDSEPVTLSQKGRSVASAGPSRLRRLSNALSLRTVVCA